MYKTSLFIKKIIPFGILFLLTPLCASAEAGKGITDESIILALLGIVILFVNQIFLIVTSFKKIMNPQTKSSILHYISFVIAIIIAVIYIPNKGYNSPLLFDVCITVPFLLGIISLTLTVYNCIKK